MRRPLSVGYVEVGPADGRAVLLLHGWPYDIHSYADVAPLLASRGYRVIVPFVRGFGTTRFLSSDTMRNGQPAAVASDVVDLMDALGIDRAILAGYDWGARSANVVAALWPDRCKGIVSVSGYLIGNQEAGKLPLPPQAEHQWWYQFYFATERGRAGYEKTCTTSRSSIWRLASPQWDFDDATFDRSAAALDNPDHVAIVDPQLPLADGSGRGRGAVRRPRAATRGGSRHHGPHDHARRRRERRAASGAGGLREAKFIGQATPTGRSPAASATTFRRKRRKRSPKPSSTSTPSERSSHVCDGLGCFLDHRRPRARRLRRLVELERRDRAAAGRRGPGDRAGEPLRGIAHDSAYLASR